MQVAAVMFPPALFCLCPAKSYLLLVCLSSFFSLPGTCQGDIVLILACAVHLRMMVAHGRCSYSATVCIFGGALTAHGSLLPRYDYLRGSLFIADVARQLCLWMSVVCHRCCSCHLWPFPLSGFIIFTLQS